VQWRSGAVDYRYDGPSRRQAGLGYGNGAPILPRLRRPVPRVAIALDTSGSMGGDELSAALNETQGILRAVGAEVTFLSCDAEVHALGQIHSVADALKLVKGGGGTDFRPVFAALEKKRERPDVLVFFTDGYGPAPARAPLWCSTVWVLVGRTVREPATWGTCIRVH
jgi:predicted metal-dependent peptidase